MKIEVDLRDKKIQDNKKIMLEIIKQDDEAFTYASKKLKSDHSFNLKAIKNNKKVYQWMLDKFKYDNKTIIFEAVRKDDKDNPFKQQYFDFKNINPKLKNDFDLVKACLKVNGSYFEDISDRLKSNKELALMAISQEWGASVYDTKNLINDEEILYAHAKYGGLIQPPTFSSHQIPKKFVEDKKYIKAFITNHNMMDNQWYLKKIKSKFLNDKELARLATKKNSGSFRQFNKKFTKDRKMILDSGGFLYADKSLKRDKKFVEKCIGDDYGNSILYADKKLINDRKLVFKAIDSGLKCFGGEGDLNKGIHPVGGLFKKYSKDEEFIKKTLKINSSFYPYMDKKYKSNRDIVIKVIKDRDVISLWHNFKHIPIKFRSDKEIAFLALISSDCRGFDFEYIVQYINKKLLSDINFTLKILKYLSNKESHRLAIEYYDNNYRPVFWHYFNKKFKRSKSFILKTLKINKEYKKLFDINDFYKNGKYDQFMYNLLSDDNKVGIKADGSFTLRNKDYPKFYINLNKNRD